MEIYKEFTIEAAHRLPNAPAGHKCSRLHGHSFKIGVYVSGAVHATLGWVVDFQEISNAFSHVHAALDHRYLNEVEGLSNPTSENLCRWIWNELSPSLNGLSKIVVNETCTTGCIYTGES